MNLTKLTYRQFVAGYLSLMLSFIVMNSFATGDQALVSPLGIKNIVDVGNSAPSITYNSITNDYFVVYSKNDESCSNQRLFGVVIDAISGNIEGNAIEVSNCHLSIDETQVLFNPDLNEYLFFYKAIGSIGDKSNLYYCSISGNSLSHTKTPSKLVGDAIADPFLDLTIGYNPLSSTYALGYHKVNSQEEYSYTIGYLNSNDKSVKPYDSYMDKSEFTDANKGLKASKVLFNGSDFVSVFELKFDVGCEIWGSIHDPTNGELVNDFFKISPSAISDKYFTNPSAKFASESNEIITAYEQSYYSDAGGAYTLSDTIRVQKIVATNGTLTGPSNISLTALPGSGNTEDKKLPSISISPTSGEIIISYFGIRFAAGSDAYNLYQHRLFLDDLISISATSSQVASSMGSEVLVNNALKPISFVHNPTNNQFNLSWFDESSTELDYQIWRYDNNPPQNLELSNNSIDEELDIGTTIATLSANDPDPEDSAPGFSLVSGEGGEDNSYFEIEGNELKVLKRLSFEEANSREIRIKAEDTHGKSIEKSFIITILNINEGPFDLTLTSPLSITENEPANAFSSLISIHDDDIGNTHSYELIDGDSSDHNSNFRIESGVLKLSTPVNYEDTSRQYVRIKATDNTGLSTEKAFFIEILNVNEKPYGLSLTAPLAITENEPANVFSSLISIHDDDIGNTHSYELVDGDSSDHNSNFRIESGVLKLTTPLNYEDTSRQYVRIKATDNTDLRAEKAFFVEVMNVNEKPTDFTLSQDAIPENVITSMTLSVDDPDETTNYFFTKPSGEQYDNGIFELSGNILKPLVFLDFETKDSYQVRLSATDGEYDTTRVFTITVLDANDSPDSVRLSANTIETDMPGGTTIGQLLAFDQDAGDNHIYNLIEGDQYFFINGSDLNILNTLIYDYSNPNNNLYSILINVDDGNGGIKEESLTIEVVLYKDEELPTFLLGDNKDYLNQESKYASLSISAKDNTQIDTVYFYYRPIRSDAEFLLADSIEVGYDGLTRANISATVDSSEFDEMGIEYYFKAIDATGNESSTEVAYMYRAYSNLPFKPVNANFNGDAASYRIIANPYINESNNKVSKIFSDYNSSGNDSWRLFSYDNQQLKEIGNVSGTALEQGHGYWFNKAKPLSQQIFFEEAKVTKNNQTDLLEITLRDGWNMIGNPYPFTLQLENILIENNLEEGDLLLQTFNGNYKGLSELDVFEGAFLYIDEGTTITIPVLENPTNGSRIAKGNDFENGWLLELSLDNGEINNNLGGLGMHENATASYDRFDRPLLPRFINHLDISFNHPEHHSKSFSKDIVAIKENFIWEFVASTNLNEKNVTLSWGTALLKNASNQLIIYDVLRDKSIDVKQTTEYSFSLDAPSTFKAIYGDQAFIKESLSKIRIETLKPYPNPFNDLVSIPINLPFSNESYNVDCQIFNLMGEKVYEENIENIAYGLFELQWDESQNESLEQGIYIYSIRIKNGFLTNNFHGRMIKN